MIEMLNKLKEDAIKYPGFMITKGFSIAIPGQGKATNKDLVLHICGFSKHQATRAKTMSVYGFKIYALPKTIDILESLNVDYVEWIDQKTGISCSYFQLN